MTARTNNGEEQTTAENRQRRRTGNGEEQATAKNRQRQGQGQIRRFWLRQNDDVVRAAPE
jgi:hypothetical protein